MILLITFSAKLHVGVSEITIALSSNSPLRMLLTARDAQVINMEVLLILYNNTSWVISLPSYIIGGLLLSFQSYSSTVPMNPLTLMLLVAANLINTKICEKS